MAKGAGIPVPAAVGLRQRGEAGVCSQKRLIEAKCWRRARMKRMKRMTQTGMWVNSNFVSMLMMPIGQANNCRIIL